MYTSFEMVLCVATGFVLGAFLGFCGCTFMVARRDSPEAALHGKCIACGGYFLIQESRARQRWSYCGLACEEQALYELRRSEL